MVTFFPWICDWSWKYRWFYIILFIYLLCLSQRVRFSTSVLFSLSVGVELMTPVFPQHFLLLATVANIAKSISLASYIATGVYFSSFLMLMWWLACSISWHWSCNFELFVLPENYWFMWSMSWQSAIHRSFAVADNLGEVSAKAQVKIISISGLV